MRVLPEIGVSFDGRDPADVALAKAEAVAARDPGTIWLACHLYQRDPVATAGVLLGRYPGVNIVLVALSPFVMHPVYIAMTAATLNEFYPGRVSLCLGVGAPVDLANAGIKWPSPLGAMRESIDICRSLFSGDAVRLEGKRFQIRNQALATGRQDIPVLLAASGPKMLRLAGKATDGVVLSAGASTEFVAQCIEEASEAGTSPGFKTYAFVYSAVAEEKSVAYGRVRRPLAVTLRGGHHTRNLEMAGSTLDQKALADAIADGEQDKAEGYITDSIVARHAAAGTAEMFAARIADYRAAGADSVVLASTRTPQDIDAVLGAASR